jgi:hypothetical protein
LWATQLGIVALFGEKTKRAADVIEQNPGKSFGTGFFMTTTAGLVGFLLVVQPFGPLRLVGWITLAVLLCLVLLGSAGLAALTARRIQKMDARLSDLGAVGRGAAFLIAMGLLPFVGTFLLFPILFCFSLGAGFRVMRERNRFAENTPILPTVQVQALTPITPVAPPVPGTPWASRIMAAQQTAHQAAENDSQNTDVQQIGR